MAMIHTLRADLLDGPPLPMLEIELEECLGGDRFPLGPARLDTGADLTILPGSLRGQLEDQLRRDLPPICQRPVRGEDRLVFPFHIHSPGLPTLKHIECVFLDEFEHALVGINALVRWRFVAMCWSEATEFLIVGG